EVAPRPNSCQRIAMTPRLDPNGYRGPRTTPPGLRNPSAVVIGGPAERLVRGPHPSVTISVDPTAVRVRTPLPVYIDRHPHILALQPYPVTVGLEPVVKNCPLYPAFWPGTSPLWTVLVKGPVPIIRVPILIDVEVNGRIA